MCLRSILAALLVVSLGFGCGGAQRKAKKIPGMPPEQPCKKKPGKPSAIEKLGLSGPKKAWADMSFDARKFYMIGKVEPITKEVFCEFDPKIYGAFTCESCHGPKPEGMGYAMPSRALPEIPRPGTGAYRDLKGEKPEMVRFMEEEVTPAMRKLLGKPAYDPEKDEGFGCGGCHLEPN